MPPWAPTPGAGFPQLTQKMMLKPNRTYFTQQLTSGPLKCLPDMVSGKAAAVGADGRGGRPRRSRSPAAARFTRDQRPARGARRRGPPAHSRGTERSCIGAALGPTAGRQLTAPWHRRPPGDRQPSVPMHPLPRLRACAGRALHACADGGERGEGAGRFRRD